MYDDGTVRDYGDLLPLNVPLTVTVGSVRAALVDQSGVVFSAQGKPFQITPADFQSSTVALGPTWNVRPPQAKMIHVFTSGIH